ncbi:MAG: hypothetical protein ABSF70_07370 [Terracidiphilus sp.]|jgi:hypothetical protein
MIFAKSSVPKFLRTTIRPPSVCNGAAVLLGAFFLAWPAFYNGFPLIYPDSMTYLADGRTVARALFLHQFSDYYGIRSFFYSLVILPWHWNLSPWPIVALQCLLVAWVLWLVVRAVTSRRTVARYLILVLFLSALTSVGWFASFIMPDILGPLLYLSIFLLVFAGETLTRAERLALYLIAGWAITAHASHLLLAAGLWALLLLYAAIERKQFLRRTRALGEVAAIIAIAAAAQMALHGYLYGKPSLNGERPPFLMASVIVDGPGRWYLTKNCAQLQWTVCKHLSQISADPNEFLWGSNDSYESDSDDERKQIDQEEMPLVLAAVRAYPRQQFSRSATNFGQQLLGFGLYGFDSNDWMLTQFDEVMPRARSSYLESRQARNTLPLDQLTNIQWWTVVASLVAIAFLIPPLWRRHSPRLAALSFVVVAMVVANAAITGVLSAVDDRYQCRLIWLIPLLAAIFFLNWIDLRESMKMNSRPASS